MSESALQVAGVALLEPLLRAESAQRINEALADAIERCAQTGQASGIRSLSYLNAIAGPFLRRGGLTAQPESRQDLLEPWVHDLLAFCAGQRHGRQVVGLVEQLANWPGLAPIPAEFAQMIIERLQRDASLINPPALELVEIARDELDMLAQECEQLLLDLVPALSAHAQWRAQPQRAGVNNGLADAATSTDLALEDITRDYGQRLRNLVVALGHLQLPALMRPLQVLANVIEPRGDGSQPIAEPLLQSLIQLPAVLMNYFRLPEPSSQSALTDVLVSASFAERNALQQSLASVRVVPSRQVIARELVVDGEAMSLQPRVDADGQVIAQLKRELPATSELFTQAIEQVRAGDVTQLATAQRLAHTIKGAANTAGIKGIAVLTHQLEDVLQIVQASGQPPAAELAQLLVSSADCLAEMSEYVAGLGLEPKDSAGYCEALAQWVNLLLAPDKVATQADLTELSAAALVLPLVPPLVPPLLPPVVSPLLPPDVPTPVSVPQADYAQGGNAAATDLAGAERTLQVSAPLLEKLSAAVSEASIKLAQLQERVARLDGTRVAFRNASDGLQVLSSELERLVDVRGIALTAKSAQQDFDSAELDEYNDLHTASRRIVEAGADNRVLDRNLDQDLTELKELSGQIELLQVDMHELVMRTRSAPFSSITPRLQRAVRQAARMSDKSAELVISGGHIDIDGQMLLALVDPLAHLLRNAVDHGIESAPQRAASGKPAIGRISLSVERDNSHVRIVCADDGAGLDRAAIRSRAGAMGMVAPQVLLNDDELTALILRAGFSTRAQANQLSGRGIGLDVVQQAILRLRGRIQISDEPGAGTRFALTVPLTMVNQAVMVINDPRYRLAVATGGIEEILAASAAVTDVDGVVTVATGAHGNVELLSLAELLGLPAQAFSAEAGPGCLLLIHGGDGRHVAVAAPALGQARNVAVRPVPDWLGGPAAVSGLAVLGDGAVAPVLHLPTLLLARTAVASREAMPFALEEGTQPLCLLVDDSVSVRRTMELFLKDLGMRVLSASDGSVGLDLARRHLPALILADLEMPRMNGIELTSALRADPRFATVPIIMITSRFSNKHRQKALAAGVSVFLTKPYSEDALASEIQRCLLRTLG